MSIYLFSLVFELLTDSTRLVANADKLGFYACQFLGYQDTLYVKSGTQYYSNSKIEGKSFFYQIHQSHYLYTNNPQELLTTSSARLPPGSTTAILSPTALALSPPVRARKPPTRPGMHSTTAISRVLLPMVVYSLAARGVVLLASSTRTPTWVGWSMPRDGPQWHRVLHHCTMSTRIMGLDRALLRVSS